MILQKYTILQALVPSEAEKHLSEPPFPCFFLLRVRVSCAADGMVIKKGCSCGTPLWHINVWYESELIVETY